MDPISPVADATEARKEVIAPQSSEPLVTDEPDGRVAARRSGWMKAALVLAALIVAGAVAYSTIIRRPHSNGLFAVETVPLAVADAKDAEANARASAASARKSALAAETLTQKTVLSVQRELVSAKAQSAQTQRRLRP
jgi:sugar phosphate permease